MSSGAGPGGWPVSRSTELIVVIVALVFAAVAIAVAIHRLR